MKARLIESHEKNETQKDSERLKTKDSWVFLSLESLFEKRLKKRLKKDSTKRLKETQKKTQQKIQKKEKTSLKGTQPEFDDRTIWAIGV